MFQVYRVYLPTSQHALFGQKHQPQSTDPTNLNPRRVMLEIEQTELAIHWRGLLNYGPLHRQPLFGFNMIWISWSIFDSPLKYFAGDGHFPFIFIYNSYIIFIAKNARVKLYTHTRLGMIWLKSSVSLPKTTWQDPAMKLCESVPLEIWWFQKKQSCLPFANRPGVANLAR